MRLILFAWNRKRLVGMGEVWIVSTYCGWHGDGGMLRSVGHRPSGGKLVRPSGGWLDRLSERVRFRAVASSIARETTESRWVVHGLREKSAVDVAEAA
jgi:hypothetical protein